jgi:hypothetical protein
MTSSHTESCDLVVFGTGQFAGRIVFDLAATTKTPIEIVIAGRNADRLDWLTTAANARAFMFGCPARFTGAVLDVTDAALITALLREKRPRLAVQTASSQPSAVIGESGNAWSRLVAEGGLSVTAVSQAVLSIRVGEAIKDAGIDCALINCCFPDVVNAMLTARGIKVLCGTGNVAILANAFSGALVERGRRLQVLAHYQQLGAWRQAAGQRGGQAPRVWLDGSEIEDVFAEFAHLKLTREPAIEISGASGVTLMQAFVAGQEWRGHAPGPNGLPGGYPVRLAQGELRLDLPEGIGRDEAIAWNAAFENKSGLVIGQDGKASYTGTTRSCLEAQDFPYSDGFHVSQIEDVSSELDKLRKRLELTN